MRLTVKNRMMAVVCCAGLAGAFELSAGTDLNWNEHSSGTTKDLRGVCYGNGKYIAVGNSGTMLSSENGVNWSALTSISGFDMWAIDFGNNKFVALMGQAYTQIWCSADGATWEGAVGETNAMLRKVRSLDGKFWVVGSRQTVLSSLNGATWTVLSHVEEDDGKDNDLKDFANGGGVCVAVGWNNVAGQAVILRSADNGASWSNVATSLTVPLNGIAYGNGLLLRLAEMSMNTG